MNRWEVHYAGRLLTVVFYDSDCDADYVRRGLIEHDGYPAGIEIFLTQTLKKAKAQ